jgi:hypothetical protein
MRPKAPRKNPWQKKITSSLETGVQKPICFKSKHEWALCKKCSLKKECFTNLQVSCVRASSHNK